MLSRLRDWLDLEKEPLITHDLQNLNRHIQLLYRNQPATQTRPVPVLKYAQSRSFNNFLTAGR